MKTLVLGLLAVMSTSLLADMVRLTEKIVNQSQKLQRAVESSQYGPTPNRWEVKREAMELIEMTNRLIAEVDRPVGPMPSPTHPPIPPTPYYPPTQPQQPPYYPPTAHYPYPPMMMCDQERPEVMQEVFVKIKAFAYGADGLNYSSTPATSFAQEWITKYPCAVADKYVQEFKTIKAFAYDSDGLNYSSISARDYAIEKIGSYCVGVDLKRVYAPLYQFAYSSNGLNMSSTGARAYAQPKLEAQAFVCQNFSRR